MAKSPDAFRTIGEVADWLETPTHVIRFWESRFDEIDPVQKGAGRRYFRPSDLLFMGGLKKLLHEDGLTIKAVQSMIQEKGIDAVTSLAPALPDSAPEEEDEAPEPLQLEEPVEDTPVELAETQKPMLLTPMDEVLEPSHRWHLKLTDQLDSASAETVIERLSGIRAKLRKIDTESREILNQIQD